MVKQAWLLTAVMCWTGEVLAADKAAYIEPPMVAIPGGEFQMGSERAANSQPVRKVAIKPFRMGKYEVTLAEYRLFLSATGYKAPRMCMQLASKRGFESVPNEYAAGKTLHTSSDFEPVTCIGWHGADAYVKWLAKETGRKFRLPTEAEWEYAHRAGSSHRYFFGNDETQVCRYGNVADRSAEAALKRDYDGMESKEYVGVMPCDDKAGYASIVGMYEPNGFGLHDTLGNVAEYVQDCYHENYVGAAADGSARQQAECEARVVRGGSWHWRAAHFARRSTTNPKVVGSMEGFRIAEDIDPAVPGDLKKGQSAFETELAEAQRLERERRQ
jgi:formylglycine-generating enzyme required for sulfatase activity